MGVTLKLKSTQPRCPTGPKNRVCSPRSRGASACSVSPDDGAIAKSQSARKQNTKELFYVQPRRLVAPHGVDGVLHRLVAQRVDRRDEEVEGADQLLAALHQRLLRVGVVQELVLQLGRLVRQVGEDLAERVLKRV